MPVDCGKIGKYQKIKKDGKYLWPCEGDLKRMIHIFTGDILKRSEPGIFTKASGIGVVGIHIPEEDIIECEDNDNHFIM